MRAEKSSKGRYPYVRNLREAFAGFGEYDLATPDELLDRVGSVASRLPERG